MVWKVDRASKPVIFTSGTALASVMFSHAYQQFLEKSCPTEAPSHLVFGDQTTFNVFEVPSMVWAECGLPSRVSSDDSKGGLSTFAFMNGVRSIINVFGNIRQSCGIETAVQLLDFLQFF